MTDVITKLYSPEYYEKLQEQIKAIGDAPNMVIDREASFKPSFIYSSAQISDHSSMMHQYMLVDKPLLWYQNLSLSMTGEELIGCGWMEQARNFHEIRDFLEHIRDGVDRNSQRRGEVIRQDLPLADGRCGERVCEAVWNALHQDDGISRSSSSREQKGGREYGKASDLWS